MKFEGLYTPIITPYRDDYSPDWDGLAGIVDSLIAAGIHGIISGGSTGEYYAQSLDERLAIAKFVKERIAGRAPLMIGTGAIRQEDSIAVARAAKAMGADAILVGSPPYAVPTEQENALNTLAIDGAADLPIMLYNYPGRMGVAMGEDYLKIVSRSKNIVGIKESSGDINRLHLLACGYPAIAVCCGMDDQALEFFAWGSRCWVAGGSNFLPSEHIALYETCVLKGDFAKGRRIMSALMPLMRVLEQGGKFIQCIKHGCEMGGLRAGPPRPPLLALTPDDKAKLESVVREAKRAISAIMTQPSP
jgi:4-hydroxy-tetrahydrodipicolinate synthase